jgi:uridine kinase
VRDITERQRALDLILWQNHNTVLPAARQYLLPSKAYADLVLESSADLPTVEQSLHEAIVNKRAVAGDR